MLSRHLEAGRTRRPSAPFCGCTVEEGLETGQRSTRQLSGRWFSSQAISPKPGEPQIREGAAALGAVDIAVLAEQRGAMAAARPGRTAAGDPFERGEPRCGSRARTASIAAAGPGPVSARRTRNAAAGRGLRPPFVAARSRRLGAALRTTLVNISAFGVTLTPHRPQTEGARR